MLHTLLGPEEVCVSEGQGRKMTLFKWRWYCHGGCFHYVIDLRSLAGFTCRCSHDLTFAVALGVDMK